MSKYTCVYLILLPVCLILRCWLVFSATLTPIPKKTVSITGVVSSKPVVRWATQQFRLGDTNAELTGGPRVEMGDTVTVSGNYKQRVINTIYREKTLSIQDIRIVQKYDENTVKKRIIFNPLLEVRYLLQSFKDWAISRYLVSLSYTSSGLLAGMVLGAGDVMPDFLYDTMKASGLAHLVVASGSNIALVASVVLAACSAVSHFKRYLISLMAVWAYVIMAGLEAPVVRAGIMISLIWLAQMLGRKASGVYILYLTATIMIIIEPAILFSLSFQLSLAATAGLVLFSKPLEENARRLSSKFPLAGWGMGMAVQTIAAQILILPLLLHYFAETNLLSLPANIAVAWLVTPVVLGGMALLSLSAVWPALAELAALPLEIALRYISWVGQTVSVPKYALLKVELSWVGVFIWWAAVLLLRQWWLHRHSSRVGAG